MTTDRHKRPPESVRLPDGLKAWCRAYADGTGQSVSAVIIAALEEKRARVEAGQDTAADHPA
jgi:hypothetical protein